jgi:AcrR family transcriptional regulator
VPPKRTTLTAPGGRRIGGGERVLPTREVILDTAERLFARRGVDGVTVRDLAREMGLTAPSLYNHFASKQALYDAVLERGLHPIADLLAQAWHPGALRPENVRATLDRLIVHLAKHAHLARLLQRVLLEESDSVQQLISRWLSPLYREGFAVIRETAEAAGWDAAELPHLTIGLFGLVFAYFTNTTALRLIAAEAGDPLSARSLEVQRAFLEQAIVRLLGPRPPDDAQIPERPKKKAASRPM